MVAFAGLTDRAGQAFPLVQPRPRLADHGGLLIGGQGKPVRDFRYGATAAHTYAIFDAANTDTRRRNIDHRAYYP